MSPLRCERLSPGLVRRRLVPATWLFLAAVSCGLRTAAADTFTWTGESPLIIGNNNWSNPLNWQEALIPVNDGTADVVMPDTPRDNTFVDQPWSINSLTLQGPGNRGLGGGPLTLNKITHNGTGTVTFNASVVVGPQAAWEAASGPMTFNGAITGNAVLRLFATEPITFAGSSVNTLPALVTVEEGTLVLAKSSLNGAIADDVRINGATVRWEANDQVSDQSGAELNVVNGGVADLNGKNETLAEITLSGGSRVQSNGGRLIVDGGLFLQATTEMDLGAGELWLQGFVTWSGNSNSPSRIAAGLIVLNTTLVQFAVKDSPGIVELEVAGPIAGALPGALLRKVDTGALRLTGANTYQGGTTIAGGTLIVDNTSGSGTGTGAVTVQTGALLTGGGAVGGAVTMQNGARISPRSTAGFLIGSLNVGSLSMNASSALEVEFNHLLPAPLRVDVLNVASVAMLNGNLVLENLNSSQTPSPSTNFTILTASSLTGSFANVANGERLDTIDGSGSFVVNYGAGSSFNPNHVVLSNFMAGLAGDFDVDGDVDGDDLTLWRNNFGTGTTHMTGDADGDGDADGGDFLTWQRQLGGPATAGATASIPEPATLASLALGTLAMTFRGPVAGSHKLIRP